MDEILIKTQGLTKQYKNVLSVDNVSIEIKKGQIVGLIGQNGAGKTTLIRLLCGLIKPTAGNVEIFHKTNEKDIAPLRKEISAIVEKPSLYENMSAKDNLLTQCILHNVKNPIKSNYIHDTLDFVGLEGLYSDKRTVKKYSLGMKQRLGIAMSMINDPKLMILDEPTNGLDPEGIKKIRDLLLKLNKEKNVTIIISSHILSELEKLATDYIFINNGRVIKQISNEDLEKECGKKLIIKCDDNLKALNLLLEHKYQTKMINEEIVIENIINPIDALDLLYQAKIKIIEMKEESNSLENYYVNLLRGGKHD